MEKNGKPWQTKVWKTIKLSAMTETVTHTGFWLTQKQYTVKSMKHYGLVCMNVGGCEFIGFWFLWATKSKYMHLIKEIAIYAATKFPLVHSHYFDDLVCLLSVCNIVRIMCSTIKVSDEGQAARLLPYSLTSSSSVEYTPSASQRAPWSTKNPRALYPAVTHNPDLLKSSTLTFVWQVSFRPRPRQ